MKVYKLKWVHDLTLQYLLTICVCGCYMQI